MAAGLSSVLCPPKVPCLAQVAASLSLQDSLSQVPSSPAEVAVNQRSLCSSYQAAPSQEQRMADLDITKAPPRASRTNISGGQLQTMREHHPTSSTNDTPKGGLGWHQSLIKDTPALWGLILQKSLSAVIMASPHEGQLHLLTSQ